MFVGFGGGLCGLLYVAGTLVVFVYYGFSLVDSGCLLVSVGWL